MENIFCKDIDVRDIAHKVHPRYPSTILNSPEAIVVIGLDIIVVVRILITEDKIRLLEIGILCNILEFRLNRIVRPSRITRYLYVGTLAHTVDSILKVIDAPAA